MRASGARQTFFKKILLHYRHARFLPTPMICCFYCPHRPPFPYTPMTVPGGIAPRIILFIQPESRTLSLFRTLQSTQKSSQIRAEYSWVRKQTQYHLISAPITSTACVHWRIGLILRVTLQHKHYNWYYESYPDRFII